MAMITRTDAAALIPEPVSREIIAGVRKQSVAMRLMRRLPNMTSGTMKQPVLSMLPVADFVNGDSGMKAVTTAAWENKQLVAGEIAAIVPIPLAVLADSEYDIWGEVQPLLVETMSRVWDRQVFSERNPKAPTEFPDPIIVGATAANNTVAIGTAPDDIGLDISNAMALVEQDGYDVTGIAAQNSMKALLRNLRTASGDAIYQPMAGEMPDNIFGVPSYFVGAGTWDATKATAIMGQWDNAVYAIRQDIQFEIFRDGVISDDSGAVVYNLMMQDMAAMRATLRIGWQMANPIDIDTPTGGGYPFSILTPAAGGGG